MTRILQLICLWTAFSLSAFAARSAALAQPLGEPDRGSPGDRMIQAYLADRALKLDAQFADDLGSLDRWQQRRPQYQREYFDMLGLWPLPERTPLEATGTGSFAGDGFVVDMLHYQSMPGLYVTANLFRPAEAAAGERLPAILYVCGHSNRGRDGNKTAYQSHGIWFARHGYVCLVVDTLQLGEIDAIHHGTYREGRWWWHSRGYTSAGVECWNGVRGIDYLVSRDDVDPERIGVTGISGGGAATVWIAAADERVKAAVPVSGMADLESYVGNRVINGHCDCMFLHNTYAWPWTRIAALVAPRPLLFVNSDADAIFPMDANERIINRLDRFYSMFGAGDQVSAVVSIGGHAYREDIRRAAFRFLNTHLKGDPRPVTDSEADLVVRGPEGSEPIETRRLRVFPADDDIPEDALNREIDRHFVPPGEWPSSPQSEDGFAAWRKERLEQLRERPLRSLPDPIPPAKLKSDSGDHLTVETEPGIELKLRRAGASLDSAKRIVLVVQADESDEADESEPVAEDGDHVVFIQPRGVGETQWTRKNPPNYVERSLVLLGQTADSGRVRDIAAVARMLDDERPINGRPQPIVITGRGAAAVWAGYAAVVTDEISESLLIDPPLTHMDADAPQFLSILQIGDIPDVLGLIAPRPLRIRSRHGSESFASTEEAYRAAGADDAMRIEKSTE